MKGFSDPLFIKTHPAIKFGETFQLPPRLTLSWRMSMSYRNQSIDLQSKSMDWFLYDNGLRHERVKTPLVLGNHE